MSDTGGGGEAATNREPLTSQGLSALRATDEDPSPNTEEGVSQNGAQRLHTCLLHRRGELGFK